MACKPPSSVQSVEDVLPASLGVAMTRADDVVPDSPHARLGANQGDSLPVAQPDRLPRAHIRRTQTFVRGAAQRVDIAVASSHPATCGDGPSLARNDPLPGYWKPDGVATRPQRHADLVSRPVDPPNPVSFRHVYAACCVDGHCFGVDELRFGRRTAVPGQARLAGPCERADHPRPVDPPNPAAEKLRHV